MTANRLTAVTIFPFLAILWLLLYCAEVTAPPGGEEDHHAPTVIQTSPANGSINVPARNEITFWFSEGIIRPSTAKPVFISPRQDTPPKLKWKSDRLIVTLSNVFESNKTYVVTLSAEISDWRRNKMDSTVSIAFSTGTIIDSGSLGGFVTASGKPRGGVLAGLYELSTDTSEIPYDSMHPSYLTQSATDGSFKFKFLPKRKYRLVAFEDLNRNERYNPIEEPFAVTDRPTNIGTTTYLEEIYLEISQPLQKELAIASAFYTADGLIKVRLNQTIELEYIKHHLNQISFSSQSSSGLTVTARAILESNLDTSSVLTVYSGKADTGNYSISLIADSGKSPVTFVGLTIGQLKDKNPPVIIKFLPESKPQFKDKINISALFSEPIDEGKTADGTFLLTMEEEKSARITTTWTDPFHIEFTPDSLIDGASYTMRMAEFEIFDLSGNVLGDSIQSFGFSVIDADSLGSVSGNVTVELANKIDNVKHLNFTGISGNQSFDVTVSGKAFSADLPAGKYLMSGYLDENGNNKRDLGSTMPYTFAETLAKSTDTITVRARFETAGIEFRFK